MFSLSVLEFAARLKNIKSYGDTRTRALVVRSSVSQSKSLGRVTNEWIFSLFLPYVSRDLTSCIFMVHSPANRGLSDLVINAS